jgi:hypothetical protein
MSLKTYQVLSPIMADKKYEEGDTIILEDKPALELQSFGAIGESTGDAPIPGKLSASEAIAQITAAATVEAVDAILGDDTRATVVAATAARKAVLAQV